MRIFVFCVFFVEYSSDCRDKYKYLKPLLAKWSRYYFTTLGGVLTGGHKRPVQKTGNLFKPKSTLGYQGSTQGPWRQDTISLELEKSSL